MRKFLFVLTTGFALFSMFFGAGNLVYPLKLLGLNTQENCMTAVAGFSLTAVLVPLLGFLAMILFEGDWRAFFGKIRRASGACARDAHPMRFWPLWWYPSLHRAELCLCA